MNQDLAGKKPVVIVEIQTTTTLILFKTLSTNTKSMFRENGSMIGDREMVIGHFGDTKID